MRRNKIIIAILIILVLVMGIIASRNSSKGVINYDEVRLGNDIVRLQPDDTLISSLWNETEIKVNDKKYRAFPVLHGDITIGSSVDELLEAFDIKEGHALIYAEIESENSNAKNEIIIQEYTDDFFEKYEDKYTNIRITFGYKKKNKDFVSLNNKELYEEKNIIYTIDINGLTDMKVSRGKIISIKITYYQIKD